MKFDRLIAMWGRLLGVGILKGMSNTLMALRNNKKVQAQCGPLRRRAMKLWVRSYFVKSDQFI